MRYQDLLCKRGTVDDFGDEQEWGLFEERYPFFSLYDLMKRFSLDHSIVATVGDVREVKMNIKHSIVKGIGINERKHDDSFSVFEGCYEMFTSLLLSQVRLVNFLSL